MPVIVRLSIMLEISFTIARLSSEAILTFFLTNFFLHTEKSLRNLIESNWNKIVVTILWLFWNQTDVSLVPNQSENGKYNLISVRFNKISKGFLCVRLVIVFVAVQCNYSNVFLSPEVIVVAIIILRAKCYGVRTCFGIRIDTEGMCLHKLGTY